MVHDAMKQDNNLQLVLYLYDFWGQALNYPAELEASSAPG